jgi:hypothetical protein
MSRRRVSSSIEMAAAASIAERRPGLDEAFHRNRKADAVERSQSIDAIAALDAAAEIRSCCQRKAVQRS